MSVQVEILLLVEFLRKQVAGAVEPALDTALALMISDALFERRAYSSGALIESLFGTAIRASRFLSVR
ncbi:hypothetical protein GC173_09025 [bacterium]|nr:hypothetical protein [bacterium]